MPKAGLKRGGARNSAERASWQLTEWQCRNLIGHSLAAWHAGQPLNRFVTLAWGKSGIDGSSSTRATGEFIKRARDWIRAHDYSMPWVWVQERGNTFGQHAHLLLHVPPELDDLFRPMPLRWAKSITAGRYSKGTLESQKLDAARSAEANPMFYEAQLMGKVHYMLKCAPEPLEAKLGMVGKGHKPWGQASRVVGRRASHWQRQGVPPLAGCGTP